MRRLLATLCLAALLGAGCSGDSGGAAAPADPSAPASSEGEPAENGAEPVDGDVTPVQGGRLRIGVPRPASLDPAQLTLSNATDIVVIDLLYDSLTSLSRDGGAVPSLASFITDDDLLVWTFTMNGGTFAGGRSITAVDAKTSLERVAAQADESPAALRLEPIVGYADFTEGRAPEMTGIRVLDERTLEIETTEPFATLPELLASPAYGIVAVETLVGPQASIDPTPLGSGSFAVTNPAIDLFELTALDETTTFVEGVELRFFDSAAAAYDAFSAGDLDLAPVPPESIGDAVSRFGTDAFSPFHGLLHLGMNTGSPKLDNAGIREAIARAIDGDAIVKAVYGETAVSLDQIVPPGIAGAASDPCAETCTHDPEAAASIVDFIFPAGDVPTFHIDVEESDRLLTLAALVEEDLEAVGIPTEVRSMPFDEYQEFAASGDQELFVFGWIALGGSADLTLGPLFRSDSLDNVTAFVVAEIDSLFKAARAEADADTRAELLADIEEKVAAKVPVVPIAQFRSLSVADDRVQDLEVNLDGTFDVTRVWLADGT